MRTGPHHRHIIMSQEKANPVSPGVECYPEDKRYTRPLGVLRLAMRQHSLTVLASTHQLHPDLGSHRTALGVAVAVAVAQLSSEVHTSLGSHWTCHVASVPGQVR